MKQKSKSTAVTAIVAALSASLAPVPAKSTTLPATAIEFMAHTKVVSTLTFELHDGQVFLPLEEATEYVNGMNDNIRAALNLAIAERQHRGKGPLFTDGSAKVTKRICEELLQHHIRVKEAIKIVMTNDNLASMYPDSLEQRMNYRNTLILFGRAIAQGEFIIRDLINAIERSITTDKTITMSNMPSDENVKEMIIAEHKNLGLSSPEFS
ncbi:TPA: iron-sulfur cluster assembly scaffold protein SufA [Escherichia coli]